MFTRTRKLILMGAVALLGMLLLACIKLEKETVVTPVPPTPTPIPPTSTPIPPTPTPVPEAKPGVLSVSLCRGLTDDERPFAETNTYSQIDPFAVSIQVENMKPENVISAHWYHEDSPIGLTERDKVAGNTYVGMLLEPQGSWIPGDYTLEISLDGEIKETRSFAVIGQAPLPGSGGGGGGKQETGEWKGYNNANLGFSIGYPGNWLVEEGESAAQFSHPQDVAAALVLVNAKPAETAEQEAEAVFQSLSKNLSNVQKSASEAQSEGWHAIIFTYTNDGTNIAGVLLSKLFGSRGYNLVFLCVQNQWETIVPIFEEMWVSFEVGQGGGGLSASDEVLIIGKVVDADTGRGVANAVFVILKEGVTVKQFIDSGNDKAHIYDSAQSGSDGAFEMNIPVQRGSSYAVFAVAKGYKPVVDTINVPGESSDPWEVTVGMQKE